MIAACPECRTQYRVDPQRLSEEGVRLRCTRCQTVFRVRAPQAPAGSFNPEPSPMPLASPESSGATPTPTEEGVLNPNLVLVATPDAENAKNWVETLRGWGLEAESAHDGVEAILKVHRLWPAAIVLDPQLPKMFGFQVCEVIKRNASLREIGVVLIGAIHHPERYRRSPSELYGADFYVEEPDMPDALAPILRDLGLAIGPVQPTAASPTVGLASPEPVIEQQAPPVPEPTLAPPAPETLAPPVPEPMVESPTVPPPVPPDATLPPTPVAAVSPEPVASAPPPVPLGDLTVPPSVQPIHEAPAPQALEPRVQETPEVHRQPEPDVTLDPIVPVASPAPEPVAAVEAPVAPQPLAEAVPAPAAAAPAVESIVAPPVEIEPISSPALGSPEYDVVDPEMAPQSVPESPASPEPAGPAMAEPVAAPVPAAATPAAPLTAPEPVAAPETPAAPEPVAAVDPEIEQAERLARIIISDVVLYNEDKFRAACEAGNVLEALEGDLADGRAHFASRVPEHVRNARDFLADELTRLARARGMA